MRVHLNTISQAFENPNFQTHGKIVKNKSTSKVLKPGELQEKKWKKASAAEILFVINKEIRTTNLTKPELERYAKIAEYISAQKKIHRPPSTIKNIFSRFQNFIARLGFKTSAEMNQQIQAYVKKPSETTGKETPTPTDKKEDEKKEIPGKKEEIEGREAYEKKRLAPLRAARLTPAPETQAIDIKNQMIGKEDELQAVYNLLCSGKGAQSRFILEDYFKSQKENNKPSGKLLGDFRSTVFELDSMPGVIFKYLPTVAAAERRVANGRDCQKIAEENHFDRLKIPKMELLELNGKKTTIIMEEKLDIIGDNSRQEEFYAMCSQDPALMKQFQEDMLQLAKFIALTGYTDVKYDNIALLNNGRGIALIDLEDFDDEYLGLYLGVNQRPDLGDGLLNCLSPEIIGKIETMLSDMKLQLPPELDFQKIIKERTEYYHKRNELNQFYRQNGIVDEKSPFTVPLDKLKLSEQDTRVAQMFIDLFNKEIQQKESCSLSAQRRYVKDIRDLFAIYHDTAFAGLNHIQAKERMLAVLKIFETNNLIFSSIDEGNVYRIQF